MQGLRANKQGCCVYCEGELLRHFDYCFREGAIGFMGQCKRCERVTIEWFTMEYGHSSEDRERGIPEII